MLRYDGFSKWEKLEATLQKLSPRVATRRKRRRSRKVVAQRLETLLVRRLTNPTRKRSLYPISQRSREKGGAELSILVQSVGISSATWVPWSPTIPMSIPIHISVKHVESTSSQLKLSRNTRQKKCTGAMCVTGSLLVPWRCRSTTEILM